MAAFVRGDVVVVPFPFSGEQKYKRRPAIVIASWSFAKSTDYLLCVISAQAASDPNIMEVSNDDLSEFKSSGFLKRSYIRPAYLFAADEALIVYKMGKLKAEKFNALVSAVHSIVDGN